MTAHAGQERRRSQRVSYTSELLYRDRNKNNQGFKHAYGKNLSEHGLLFETYEEFPPCTILEVKLELFAPSALKNSFSILAEVVRTEEVKRPWLYYIAVSFCKIEDDCRHLIREYTVIQLQESYRVARESLLPSGRY